MPSLRYQHKSEDLWKRHEEGTIDSVTYSQLLEQIKNEELATKAKGSFGLLTSDERDRIESDIWEYEHTQQDIREQAAQRKAEADRKRTLTPTEKYKEEIPRTIARYREESNHYRRIANRLQIIIIVGSVLVTSATSAAGFEFGGIFKWIAPAISIVVAISAGLTGYFKFRERSFNLQQTADNIEQEFIAVELGIGYYRDKMPSEALQLFAERVELLKDEQKKRQQQLEQPTVTKHVQNYL